MRKKLFLKCRKITPKEIQDLKARAQRCNPVLGVIKLNREEDENSIRA